MRTHRRSATLLVALFILTVLCNASFLCKEASSEEPTQQSDSFPFYEPDDVRDLFNARKEKFEYNITTGEVRLHYNFRSSSRPDAIDDWLPAADEVENIKWSYRRTLRRYFNRGVVLLNNGIWQHKAKFGPDVEIRADIAAGSVHRRGMIIGVGFHYARKKLTVGANSGQQLFALKGLKHTRRPYPKKFNHLKEDERVKVGARLGKKRVSALLNDKSKVDTAGSSKFLKGASGSCSPCFAWKGKVKVFVFGVKIRGVLDPKWLRERLGDPDPEAAKAYREKLKKRKQFLEKLKKGRSDNKKKNEDEKTREKEEEDDERQYLL